MLEKIRKVVCDYLKVDEYIINLQTHKWVALEVRQICHYFGNEYKLKNKGETTLFKIGAFFGGKHHATVLHSHKHIQELIYSDKGMRAQIADLTQLLKILPYKVHTREIVRRLKEKYYLALSFEGLNVYEIAKLL